MADNDDTRTGPVFNQVARLAGFIKKTTIHSLNIATHKI